MAGMAVLRALDLGQQGFFFSRGFDRELAASFFCGFVVLGGLFLETVQLRFHVGRIGHQGQGAQRGDAVADVVAHVDDQAGDDVVDADHVVEAVLDLRHAQDADHGHHNQQRQHEGKAQPKRTPTFMFDKFISPSLSVDQIRTVAIPCLNY
jgi:hypothetical protein